MPTAYTADIYDGKDITFEDFALKCAEGFVCYGRSIDLKTIEEFEPDEYHLNKLNEYTSELKKLNNLAVSEIQRLCDLDYAKRLKEKEDSIKKLSNIEKRYDNMLKDLVKWKYPEEHEELKNFMHNQLMTSKHRDCNISYYENKEIKKLTVGEYLDFKTKNLKNSIKYSSEKWEDEKIRVDNKNKWLRQLKDSLKNESNITDGDDKPICIIFKKEEELEEIKKYAINNLTKFKLWDNVRWEYKFIIEDGKIIKEEKNPNTKWCLIGHKVLKLEDDKLVDYFSQ